MRLEWLELGGFRSYEALHLDLDPGNNIFVGDNGEGKTNIVEAVAYLSRLRSFRGAPDNALIRAGSDSAVIRGEFTAHAGSHLVEVELPSSGRRRVRWNGKQPKRFSDLASEVPVITFLPDDVGLLKGGPANRRDYLDDLAAALSPVAAGAQADLTKALKQRNALLRNFGREAPEDDLAVWEAQIAASGKAVLDARLQIAKDAQPVIAAFYGEIGGNDDISWAYQAGRLGDIAGLEAPSDTEDRYRDLLAAARRLDMDRKMTTIGPHRDDPGMTLAGLDARTHASQGEQRTLALAMRLASFELVASRRPDPPLVLLDDVFSELDPSRARSVVDHLPDAQTMITTARPEDLPVAGRTWTVAQGVAE
ncbi:MAG: DNA replication/repair protein RecF [Acidimicrobiia bacterium]|nr:DNA replication/repair protein RecF [Acidimicrobiia bacterium]